ACLSSRGAAARDGRLRAQFARPILLPLPDRPDLTGPFRSAMQADGAYPLQLRGCRAAGRKEGRRAVSDQRSAYDDGQLPWLQAVENADEPRGWSARKMLAALLVVLLAAGLVAATFFWLGRRDTAVSGPPE